ncbi:MAG: CYTH domain-containing protein [Lachnospiraceae bacterium]|nr:CYTH domain-containing protein [Lachnospiraceae bacterium]
MEIEKKFLLNKLPESLSAFEHHKLIQAYISAHPTVRIRKWDDQYLFTFKEHNARSGHGDVCINEEHEFNISQESFEALLKKTEGNIVEKTRYVIPLHDGKGDCGHRAEIDIFEGRLKGLMFAEVEFKDEADADNFKKPDFLGKNVSGDRRFTNTYLAATEQPDIEALMNA